MIFLLFYIFIELKSFYKYNDDNNKEELKQMHRRKRKLITMHRALHPRDDINRL